MKSETCETSRKCLPQQQKHVFRRSLVILSRRLWQSNIKKMHECIAQMLMCRMSTRPLTHHIKFANCSRFT